MKNVIISLVLIVIYQFAFSQDPDKEAIKNVIQTAYVDGLQNEGNAEKIDFGFHKDFRLQGVGKNGKMWVMSIEDWKQSALKSKKEGKLPRKKSDLYSVKFLDIDIEGNAAVAKLECYSGNVKTYIDYISLYKFNDGWKMVNKIYYKVPNY